jgi:hypothetical protein
LDSQTNRLSSIAYDIANCLGFLDDLIFRGYHVHQIDSGSSVSLSTLHCFRYLEQCKTRYAVKLVLLAATGLSPARCAPLVLAPWLT